ncbi:MAG TPA: sodium:solute symporter [Gemmatimonadaceae bacterium]|nr:sodium:solute symporter [Gemmatimonadaceae bacterium]
MHPLNWAIVIAYLVYVSVDGIRRAKGTSKLDGYFLGNRSLPWWVVGLSVMATQLSAVTMIGTTGQGAVDGMRFVQFYFGLPVALVILGVTIVPFLHRARVYTAYEFLERRFDAKTRSLTSFLFLLSRGLSCGTIIAAPAVVFSAIFGWPMLSSVALIGVPTVLYTMIGGVQAVAWTDVKQIILVISAIVAVVVVLLIRIPVSPDDALRLAGAVGRLRVFDFSFNLHETYTFWSGIIGGTFLMLSYFGTDQSQVQRYLTARTVDEARSSHLISAYWKIPLQALILMVGVLVFVYYVFVMPPLYFNPAQRAAVQRANPLVYTQLEREHAAAWVARERAAMALTVKPDSISRDAFRASERELARVRTEALARAGKATGTAPLDVNYIIPHFVLAELPLGLAGIFIAAVMAAAMSAVAGELASLSSTTVIDFYRRWVRPEADDAHYLRISRAATGAWGIFACVVATFAATLGSLIEVVNRFGSFFYGSILGVFLLAMIPRIRASGAFFGLIGGMVAVSLVSFGAPSVSFLWYNVVGALAVVAVGLLLSVWAPGPRVRT